LDLYSYSDFSVYNETIIRDNTAVGGAGGAIYLQNSGLVKIICDWSNEG
jgi:hypothetical protein